MRIVNKRSYTLMEVMIVMVIITVVASLALPRYGTVVERSRSAEGVQILTTLLAAQHRLRLETGSAGYKQGTAGSSRIAANDFDVNFSTSTGLSYFTGRFEIQTHTTASPLATVFRRDAIASLPTYRLEMSDTGVITCVDMNGNTLCSKFF